MKHLLTQDIEGADWGRIVAIGEGDAAQVFIKGFDFGFLPYKLVDLGLSVKWADRNLGASSPEDGGLYFQWGDTQGYTAEQCGYGEGQKAFASDFGGYVHWNSETEALTKYAEKKPNVILDIEDDAAVAETKTKLRMPTEAEMEELFNRDKTTIKWVVETKEGDTWDGGKEYESMTAAGVKVNDNLKLDSDSNFVEEGSTKRFLGVRFYGKGDYATNSIFVPVAGYCLDGSVGGRGYEGFLWSSSLNSGYVLGAKLGNFDARGYFGIGGDDRCVGFSVRAVAGGVQ